MARQRDGRPRTLLRRLRSDADDEDDDDDVRDDGGAASDARAVDVCDETWTNETCSNDTGDAHADDAGGGGGFGIARVDDCGECGEERASGDDDVDARGGVRRVSGGYERG